MDMVIYAYESRPAAPPPNTPANTDAAAPLEAA
jgi:hypothetical protein